MSGLSFCDHFLRSVNLKLDLEDPSRIEHFHPTGKSVQIIRAILGLEADRAFISTAAYGSGKSLASLFSALCLENRPETQAILGQIGHRLTQVDAEAGDFVARRIQSRQQGLVLTFEGFSQYLLGDLRQAIHEGFARLGKSVSSRRLGNLCSLDSILRFAAAECQAQNLDRIALVWDEFGRHLEGLISSGQAGELARLQQLAETITRLEIPATLTLLLHQHFFQYAGSLNQSARSEWRKIEGRFQAIQYVDDSREMTELIAAFLQALRGEDIFAFSAPLAADPGELARCLLESGFFASFEDPDRLAQTLKQALPLDPAVLHALPKLSGRIAQNERTVFDFIRQVASKGRVHLGDLYDYFAPLMRADTGFGGTYKHWIETESALAKAQSQTEELILKAACLLGIGLSGQRATCRPSELALAVAGWHLESLDSIRQSIDALIERKLLLHRRHADEVSVWHGADVDLRSRLEEEKQRAAVEFDFEQFLAREYPPPVWKPVRYNACRAIRRYYVGRYMDAETLLKQGFDQPVWQIPEGQDGIVIYALVRNRQDIRRLTQKAKQMPEVPGRILAIPKTALDVYETALELFCLLRMQQDSQLTGVDPLVEPELKQMASDARRHLDLLMQRFCQPGPEGPSWYDSGRQLKADTVTELREALSAIAEARFPKTPVINSEAVVRSSLTRPMINARKKLLTGILERTGKAHLGMTGTTPDASMYRTVIHNTGLYRQDSQGIWRWVTPSEVTDANLREVWEILRCFFTEPGKDKSPQNLINQLTSPPYGIRQGLIPILIAAAYRAFPSLHALYQSDQYLPDILPSTIEDLCAHPKRYHLDVLPMESGVRRYLERLTNLFGGDETPPETDLIRAVYDALCLWRSKLPEIAWNSTRLPEPVKQFRIAVKQFQDPVRLIFDRLPQLAGLKPGEEGLIEQITHWKMELEQTGKVYETEAIAIVRKLLAGRGVATETGSLTQMATAWASRIPNEVLGKLGREQATCFKKLRHPLAGDQELIRSLAIILVGTTPEKWHDASLEKFERKLDEVLTGIEEAVIDLKGSAATRLLEDRIEQAYRRLQEAVGPEQAREIILELLEVEGIHHGNLKRSAG